MITILAQSPLYIPMTNYRRRAIVQKTHTIRIVCWNFQDSILSINCEVYMKRLRNNTFHFPPSPPHLIFTTFLLSSFVFSPTLQILVHILYFHTFSRYFKPKLTLASDFRYVSTKKSNISPSFGAKTNLFEPCSSWIQLFR